MTSSATYAVVGGGISGLVAAYRIRCAVGPTATIRVFDPADRLGGVLRTETLCGVPMDIGAEAFVARRPEVPALLGELGLADRQITTTGVRPTIYSEARMHPLPPGAVNGIPGSAQALHRLVDAATLDRVASEPDRPMTWRRGDDPSVGSVVSERFGEQVVARSVDPMLSGVYAGSAATIGIRSAVPTVAAALDDGSGSLTAAVRRAAPAGPAGPVFGAIDGGYRVLLDALVSRSAPDWVPAPVSALAVDGTAWMLTDGSGQTWPADAVVLAVSAPRTAELLADVAPDAAAAAGRVGVASAAVLAMGVPGATPLPAQSGVLVASGESLHAKAITLSTRKWGARGDAELLRMSFGRFGDDVAAATSEEQLLAWALDDLQVVFGIVVDPIEVLVHRWLGAMPQYGPGHAALAEQVRSGLPRGLAVAGNFLDGVGVPACLVAAGRAADVVLGATRE